MLRNEYGYGATVHNMINGAFAWVASTSLSVMIDLQKSVGVIIMDLLNYELLD